MCQVEAVQETDKFYFLKAGASIVHGGLTYHVEILAYVITKPPFIFMISRFRQKPCTKNISTLITHLVPPITGSNCNLWPGLRTSEKSWAQIAVLGSFHLKRFLLLDCAGGVPICRNTCWCWSLVCACSCHLLARVHRGSPICSTSPCSPGQCSW
jgi:hypothetical protein